ncbi:trehalose-phosphatase [Microbacterium sp. NC79]|nr:trehalose-phosphatase [Microbacterium sp. NC79]
MSDMQSLARTPVLLVALDFDGTLAPLVDVPSEARMGGRARAAIDQLAALPDTHVALVSGRMLADLRLVSETPPDSRILLAGSHGAQLHVPAGHEVAHDAPPSADIATLSADLADQLSILENVWVERKPYGFVVHTRLADERGATRAHAIVDGFARERLQGWRRRGGHDVVEYSERPEGKDGAIRALRDAVGATAVLFAGDDETDEDALRALQPGDLGVRVGSGVTAATMRVENATEMAELLSRLAELRTRNLSS